MCDICKAEFTYFFCKNLIRKRETFIYYRTLLFSHNTEGVRMAGPYRCTNMVVKITNGSTVYTVGVVEGFDIQIGYEGGAEPYYGSRIRKHSAGSKTATFSITRWFYTDATLSGGHTQESLLLDLFLSEVEFSLEGDLQDNAGVAIPHTQIMLTGCRLYKYRPRTGHADDIIGEEGSGQATNWTTDVQHST